jgi:hypothetical protein
VAKAAPVDGLVRDALTLLTAFETRAGEPDTSTALGLLALVAGQDVEQDEDGTWKIARKVAPDRVISTVDPEARHMHKSVSEYRDGYKAHIAVEPETPGPGRRRLRIGRRARGPGQGPAPPGYQALADATGGPRRFRAR